MRVFWTALHLNHTGKEDVFHTHSIDIWFRVLFPPYWKKMFHRVRHLPLPVMIPVLATWSITNSNMWYIILTTHYCACVIAPDSTLLWLSLLLLLEIREKGFWAIELRKIVYGQLRQWKGFGWLRSEIRWPGFLPINEFYLSLQVYSENMFTLYWWMYIV